jgi:ADP-heptose:LPS heptosyltransferase
MKSRRLSSRSHGTVKIPECKHFTGYKPCVPGEVCYERCAEPDPIGKRILIVNLDAMGNVLVTTALLPALKRKYPSSTISWITLPNAAPLLRHLPGLDRIYLWEPETWLILGAMRFDLVLNIDKSRRACAFTSRLNARKKMGFGLDENGAIVPLNPEAYENYRLGLNDLMKFRKNTKSVARLQAEQFGLRYRRERYQVVLTDEERAWTEEFRKREGIGGGEFVVGFNTGCSELYPNKKMTIEQHVELIRRLESLPGIRLVLLGGPEDTMRNAEIARHAGGAVLQTPTAEGVRRGLCSIDLCNVVISGDSFGMHAAIALGKPVIVWFGLSSASEIDLFDRGTKLASDWLACSPCWKRTCPFNLECISGIDLGRIVELVREEHERWKKER